MSSVVRRTLVIGAFATALAATLPAQESVVEKADRARFAAAISADVAALGELLAPELSYVHSGGNLETKDEYIEAIRSGKYKYKKIDLEGVRVREYGDTAVVTGKATIDLTSSGNEVHSVIRFLDVWVKRAGKWQMVAWQSTRLNP